MDDVKYLANGEAVRVMQDVEGGFLVNKVLYDPHDEDGGCDLFLDEVTIFVPQVFDKAPTALLDERIAKLESDIVTLTTKRDELQSNIREIETEGKARLETYRKYKSLNQLDKFLDGKLTHYVEHGWAFEIVAIGSSSSKSGSDKNERDLKLMTLFGRTKGDLQWGINNYSDGSGSSTNIYPCCSYEEAVVELQRLVNESLDEKNKPNSYVIEIAVVAARKYLINIDPKWFDIDKKNKLSRMEREVAELQKKLDAANDKLLAASLPE